MTLPLCANDTSYVKAVVSDTFALTVAPHTEDPQWRATTSATVDITAVKSDDRHHTMAVVLSAYLLRPV